jgi:protein-tyrosine phosphatase
VIDDLVPPSKSGTYARTQRDVHDPASLLAVSTWFRSYGFADVLDGLLIGAYPLDGDDVAMLERLGVERILNLAEDGEYRPGEREEVQAALSEAGIEERRLALTDYGGLPPALIERAVTDVISWLEEGKFTYVHCRAGWQRSAAVAAGVVAVLGRIDIDDAVGLVQSRKPSADPLPHQREDLRRWWDERDHHQAPGPERPRAATPPPVADEP